MDHRCAVAPPPSQQQAAIARDKRPKATGIGPSFLLDIHCRQKWRANVISTAFSEAQLGLSWNFETINLSVHPGSLESTPVWHRIFSLDFWLQLSFALRLGTQRAHGQLRTPLRAGTKCGHDAVRCRCADKIRGSSIQRIC
jgi:hypothetical protein